MREGKPRSEKVAVVDEVKTRLSSSSAALLTEYRGLKVGELAELRRTLRKSGGDYKVYKNTLVRFAVRDLGLDIDEATLTGPTAIAFVEGDAAAVAKALRDYSRTNANLVLKGGVLSGKALTADEARALADLPSREVLLAQLAGALQAPLVKMAGLLQALPRNMAYGLKALIDQKVASGDLVNEASIPVTDGSEVAEPADREPPAVSGTSDTADSQPDGDPSDPSDAADERGGEAMTTYFVIDDQVRHVARQADYDEHFIKFERYNDSVSINWTTTRSFDVLAEFVADQNQLVEVLLFEGFHEVAASGLSGMRELEGVVRAEYVIDETEFGSWRITPGNPSLCVVGLRLASYDRDRVRGLVASTAGSTQLINELDVRLRQAERSVFKERAQVAEAEPAEPADTDEADGPSFETEEVTEAGGSFEVTD